MEKLNTILLSGYTMEEPPHRTGYVFANSRTDADKIYQNFNYEDSNAYPDVAKRWKELT